MGSATTAVLAAGLGSFKSLTNVDMLNNRAKTDGEDAFSACVCEVLSWRAGKKRQWFLFSGEEGQWGKQQ
jgi:hypothetical protein